MPRTITCQNCGILLNVPADAPAGKRMKCPKCGHRFAILEKDLGAPSAGPGEADAANTSTYEAPKPKPKPKPRPSKDDEPLIPIAEGDLREAFDLPLLSSDAEKSIGSRKSGEAADAAALFRDDHGPRRRTTGAEARSRSRPCSRCHAIVPQGMSICPACGTDQESGRFIDLDDDLFPPPPPGPSGPPIHVAIVGMLCGLVGVILAILALVQSAKGAEGVYQYGWIALGIIAGYGVYGSVLFIQGKSIKNLLLALTLGLFVNIMSMIALPIFEANFEQKEQVVTRITAPLEDPNPDEIADWQFKPLVDRLDQRRITWGVALVIVYATLAIYLNSPIVKRYFARRHVEI